MIAKVKGVVWKRIEPTVIRLFHKLYYHHKRRQTWENTYFFGVRVLKCPFDLWAVQEILFETKPDLIIETGSFNGGSALYMATICEGMGQGQIISVDLDPQQDLPEHPRIRYIKASSTDPATVSQMSDEANSVPRTMVVLDSDHSRDHVLAELRAYAPLVSPGCYLIVEDTNVNGHPVFREHGPGPAEALAVFMAENLDFEADPSREKFMLSFNPGGFLRRKVEFD